MSNTILKLKNPYTGEIKTAPLGFSWTVFLFGFLVPLVRKDWTMALIIALFYIPTLGLASIPFAFFYNDIYAETLFRKGYSLLYYWGDLKKNKLEKLKNPKTIF